MIRFNSSKKSCTKVLALLRLSFVITLRSLRTRRIDRKDILDLFEISLFESRINLNSFSFFFEYVLSLCIAIFYYLFFIIYYLLFYYLCYFNFMLEYLYQYLNSSSFLKRERDFNIY